LENTWPAWDFHAVRTRDKASINRKIISSPVDAPAIP
jgi:hypothetical protein